MAIPEGAEAPEEEQQVPGNVTELHVVRDNRGVEITEGEPLSGEVKEYSSGQAPSERRMSEMEETKDANEQAKFDNFAEKARQEKREQIKEEEKGLMGKLRKFLGGGK